MTSKSVKSMPVSDTARPVKTLPRPVYKGDEEALINLCDRAPVDVDVDETRRLIEDGINVNTQNEYGYTALMYAVMNNNIRMVQELIRAGADVNVQGSVDGMTALIMCLMYNHTSTIQGLIEIVHELIRAGASLLLKIETDQLMYNGKTAQQIAHAHSLWKQDRSGWTEISCLLKEAEEAEKASAFAGEGKARDGEAYADGKGDGEADVFAGEGKARDGEAYADGKGDGEADADGKGDGDADIALSSASLSSASLSARPVKSLSPVYKGNEKALINVCAHSGSGDARDARQLIALGINVNYADDDGTTALYWAAYEGNLEIVQVLINAGASIDVQDNFCGWSALIFAVQNGHIEIVQELIRAGAALDLKSIDGRAIIHYVVEGDHLEIVQELLRTSTPLDEMDDIGMTALMYAAKDNCPNIAHELICAGVALDLQDKYGMTALMHAKRHNSIEIMQELIRAGAKGCKKGCKEGGSGGSVSGGAGGSVSGGAGGDDIYKCSNIVLTPTEVTTEDTTEDTTEVTTEDLFDLGNMFGGDSDSE